MPGAVMISAMFRAALNGQAQGPNLPHSAASLPAWAAMSRSRNGGAQVLRRRVSPSYARRNSVGKRLPRHGTAGALGSAIFWAVMVSAYRPARLLPRQSPPGPGRARHEGVRRWTRQSLDPCGETPGTTGACRASPVPRDRCRACCRRTATPSTARPPSTTWRGPRACPSPRCPACSTAAATHCPTPGNGSSGPRPSLASSRTGRPGH